tara:strand:- start:2315 stop:2767 length:453 start_codon:yes stop_codon:yes gene_type:complete
MNFHVVDDAHSLERFNQNNTERLKNDKYTIYEITSGRDRSLPQNKLINLIYRAVAKQLYGNDFEFARCECKLRVGVPILRRDNEDFKKVYDKNIRHYDYEEKLKIMSLIQVSSLMNVEQGSEYINGIMDNYAQTGVGWGELIINQHKNLK